MRSVPVFLITLILSMTILVTSYHGFISRGSMRVIVPGLTVIGVGFGMIAGWWSWVRRHPAAFVGANFTAGVLIVLPVIVVTYGFAMILLTFAPLWAVVNLIGFTLMRKIRAANRTGAPTNSG